MSYATEQNFVLLAGTEAWRIARVHGENVELHNIEAGLDASPEDRAAIVARTLQDLGHDGGALALSLPSPRCLCAEFATDDLERAGRRQAMAYRMEEHLPIAAEDIVVDFLDTTPGRTIGVCVGVEEVRPTIDALASHDLQVRHLLCEALLVAGWAVSHDESIDAVLYRWKSDEGEAADSWDVVEFAGRKPAQWWWFANDREDAIDHLKAIANAREEPLRVAAVGEVEPVEEAGMTWCAMQVSPAEAVADRAVRVLQDAVPAWIDLRRDALAPPHQWAVYRTPAVALAVATALLLLSVIGIGQYRAAIYAQHSDALHTGMLEVYRSMQAGESNLDPFTLKRRLELEKRQLEGIGGVAASSVGPAEMSSPSALVQLDRLLSELPGSIRFRILEITIDPDRIRVEGQAQSHAEAEQLVVSLRESGEFEVSPPETRSLRREGVSFRFEATHRSQREARPSTDGRVRGTTAAAAGRGGDT